MYYVDAVNSVLKRLRENDVLTVDQDERSKVVGEFVNDALKEVEDAWDWQVKYTTDNIPVVAGVYNYTILDSNGRITINNVYNLTDSTLMRKSSKRVMRHQKINDTGATTSPYTWAQGPMTGGHNTIDIHPTPDKAYTLNISYYQRSGLLVADGDEIEVPAQPVVLLAYAKALRERGEDPQSTALIYQEARRSLSDAVAYDSALDDDDTTWEVV